ncbi:MAG: DUF58 domain-containing protein [Planctomycetes bacterium]|nr:DUF58 domain-containing protein [Planctomycetota bacterium]
MGYSPTRLALMLAIAPVALAVLVLAQPSLFLPWVAVTVGLLVLLGVDALLLPRRGTLELERHLPTEVGVGVPFQMRLTVGSDSGFRVGGRLYDILPPEFEGSRDALKFSVNPGEEETWTLEYKALDRGKYDLDQATLVTAGPLHLMRRVLRVEAKGSVSIIPGVEILRSNELILKAARDADAGLTRARGVGRGGEFESLAPYVPGDPPQSVDWKAYARTGTLAVRRYIPERRRHVMLACDAGRLMGTRVDGRRKVDLALDSLTKLAAAALQRGDLVGLVIFDGEVQTLIPPKAGSGQLARIVRASLAVEPRHSETAYTTAFVRMNHALGRRSLVVLATDFDNEAQGWELQRNIAQISRKHVAIVAAMRDPVFHETVVAQVDDLHGAYRQLASLTLLEERHNILSRIHAAGVHTIDAEPDELTGPLLNLYGRVVTSGKL